MSSRAAVRKWNQEFRADTLLASVGATQTDTPGIYVLPNGVHISAYPGRPGRAVLMLHVQHKTITRNFAAKQVDLMREWAFSGGIVARDIRHKALAAAAPDLLSKLKAMHELALGGASEYRGTRFALEVLETIEKAEGKL